MNRFYAIISLCVALLGQPPVLNAQDPTPPGSSPAAQPTPAQPTPAQFSPEERARRVARAEADARQAFAENHYIFVTPHGTVDPAEGGLPPFAQGLHRWAAYRGNTYVTERRLLLVLGRNDEARIARLRKVGAATLTGVASLGAGLSAGLPGLSTPVRGVGVLGGFALGVGGLAIYDRNSRAVDDLFFQVQRLNDTIRQNIRAQYRLQYGVPMEAAPSSTGPEPSAVPSTGEPASSP